MPESFKLTNRADLPDMFSTLAVGDIFESLASGEVCIKISSTHACKLADALYFHPGHEAKYLP